MKDFFLGWPLDLLICDILGFFGYCSLFPRQKVCLLSRSWNRFWVFENLHKLIFDIYLQIFVLDYFQLTGSLFVINEGLEFILQQSVHEVHEPFTVGLLLKFVIMDIIINIDSFSGPLQDVLNPESFQVRNSDDFHVRASDIVFISKHYSTEVLLGCVGDWRKKDPSLWVQHRVNFTFTFSLGPNVVKSEFLMVLHQIRKLFN